MFGGDAERRKLDEQRTAAMVEEMRKENERKRIEAEENKKPVDASRSSVNQQLDIWDEWKKTQMDTKPQQIENAQTAQSRAEQVQALQYLQNAARGLTPSAAQIQMQQGNDAAIAQQMAMANSVRGGFNPAAIRQAQMQGAAMQQQNIGNMGALRAQEMANAQQAYTGAAHQMGALDLARSQAQADYNLANRDYLSGLMGQGVANHMGMFGAETGYMTGMENIAMQKYAADQAAAAARKASQNQMLGSIFGGIGALIGGRK